MADKVKRSSALRLKRTLFTVVTTLLLAPSLLGQCTGKLDQRSSKTSGTWRKVLSSMRTMWKSILTTIASCFLPAFRWTTSSVYETAANPQ